MLGGKRVYLSLEERYKIKEYIDSGYTFLQISKAMNRADSCIRREINEFSINGVYDPEVAQKIRHEMNGSRTHPKTNEENIKKISDLINSGKSACEISKILHMGVPTVSRIIRENPEIRDKHHYNKIKKMQSGIKLTQADLFQHLHLEKSSEIAIHSPTEKKETIEKRHLYLEDRISNLEMQMEIILNQLRELKK